MNRSVTQMGAMSDVRREFPNDGVYKLPIIQVQEQPLKNLDIIAL